MDFIAILEKYIFPNYYKWWSLPLVYFVLFLICSFAFSSSFLKLKDLNIGENFFFYIKIFIFIGICIFYTIFWVFKKFYIKKNKKGKIGICICIYAKNNKEEKALKDNFISELEKNLKGFSMDNYINLIVIDNYKAFKYYNNDKIKNLAKKTKAHFYIYGDIKTIKCDGNGEKYFLSINGLIVYIDNKNDKNLQISISNEFVKMLPREILFLESFEFNGFKFTADIIYLTSKYMLGIAAFVSGDISLAYKLHKDSLVELNIFYKNNNNLKNIEQVIKSLPDFIAEECCVLSRIYTEKNITEKADFFIQEALIYSNNQSYNCFLIKSIKDFNSGLVDESLISVRKAEKICHKKNILDNTWKYNKAFLYFWFENYQAAFQVCESIKDDKFIQEEKIINEVEIFNLNILNQVKNKKQLYFWLGYLFYNKLKNLPKSLQYLETFYCQMKNDSKVSVLLGKSSMWIAEIKKEMKIKD